MALATPSSVIMLAASEQSPHGIPDDLEVPDIGHAARCTSCGRRRGAGAHPHFRLWIAHLRQSGQRHRLPYWAPFMREAEDAAVLAEFAATGARVTRRRRPA